MKIDEVEKLIWTSATNNVKHILIRPVIAVTYMCIIENSTAFECKIN